MKHQHYTLLAEVTDLVLGSRVSDKVIDRHVNVLAFLQLVQGVHKEVKIECIWSRQRDTHIVHL